MLSKFVRPSCATFRLLRSVPVLVVRSRVFGNFIPPSQYDIPMPKKLNIGYAMRVYWETIPLFVTTAIAILVMFSAIIWACKNKVDVVFTTRSRANISRTMDLRNPTVHKIVIINQRYEPWPEMQEVLDKMLLAEKRAIVRAQTCSHA